MCLLHVHLVEHMWEGVLLPGDEGKPGRGALVYRDSCWRIDVLERAWWRLPRRLVHTEAPGDGERAELIQPYEEKAKERSNFCLHLPCGR